MSRPHRKSYEANPHYYDYLHRFTLVTEGEDDTRGTIEMVDGGGQCVNFAADGKFQLVWSDPEHTRGYLSVTELKSSYVDDLTDFETSFKVEKGTFCLEEGWGTCHLDVKYLVAEKRFVFDRDPLEICLESRNGNLKFVLEGDESDLDRRTYYDSYECETRQELINKKVKFTDDGYFIHKYYRHQRDNLVSFFNDVVTLNKDSNIRSLLEFDKNYSIFCLYKENDGSLAGYVVGIFKKLESSIQIYSEFKTLKGFWISEIVVPDEKLQRSLQWIQHEMSEMHAIVLLFDNPSEKIREILAVAEPCGKECEMRRACKNLIVRDNLRQNLQFPAEIDATKCEVFFSKEFIAKHNV